MSLYRLITITLLMLTLLGCGTDTSTDNPVETEVQGIKYIQQESNISTIQETTTLQEPTVALVETPDKTEEEPANIEIEAVLEVEEQTNIPTTVVEEIPPPPPAVEESVNYTEQFVNERDCNQIIDKEFLRICYDYSLKVAKSVAYTIYGDLVNELNIQERPSFYVEQEIDRDYRATTSDYTNSGYDRGHLAPDASFDWSQESLDATYSLANIIPQVPEVNRQMWTKVEKYAREKATELFELNVVNVMKYTTNPTHIGDNNISVSLGYYKILFNSEYEYEECFYYANDINASSENDTLISHLVDCAEI